MKTRVGLACVVSILASISLAAEECRVIAAAHEALLKSSFECDRHFTLELNGNLKMRVISRMTYRQGEVTRETLDKEVFDKRMVYEEGETDAGLDVPFDCDHIQQGREQTLELSNPEGTETVTFGWNVEPDTLRPIRWENSETERFLWKKFAFRAIAEYKDCQWE